MTDSGTPDDHWSTAGPALLVESEALVRWIYNRLLIDDGIEEATAPLRAAIILATPPAPHEEAGQRDQQTILDANGDCATVKANARLIAAAPSMLSALECSLSFMEGEGHDELHGDLAEVIRDAIDKATWRSI